MESDMKRTAKTESGKTVVLGINREDEHGAYGYIMHADGYAVAICIPYD